MSKKDSGVADIGLAADFSPKTLEDTLNPAGHRQRLRTRFLTGGAEALADYEMLELLLFLAIPQKDVKPLAKILIAEFGCLASVLAASPGRLMQISGIKENSVTALKIVQASALRMMQQELADRPIISSWEKLIGYLYAALAQEKTEQFRVLFLDKRNHLIRDEIMHRGTIDHAPVYPREIARRALELAATALILVHNHPSGDPTASKPDIEITKTILQAVTPLGIIVHDHVIIGKQGHFSFKEKGII